MDGKWGRRSASRKTVHLKSTAKDVNELIGYANKLEMTHPDECLHHHQVHTHGGYSPTRSNDDSTICCYLIPLEKISYGAVLYLKKSSKIWTDTSWGLTLMAMIQPYLVPADWRTKSNSTRRLP